MPANATFRAASHPLLTPARATLVFLSAILSPCNDLTPPTQSSFSSRPSFTQQRRGPSRMDTPWRRMSDTELAAKISEAGGRVFIGFKDPQASAGVDETGRVLATPASVTSAKAQLRALGIRIEFEFSDMPSVNGNPSRTKERTNAR